MKFAVYLPNFGVCHDPRVIGKLGREAERAGWDGLFLWDHLVWNDEPVGDPWTSLAAVATVTSRLRIGPVVTPIPRRRPWQVAKQAVALDHLSSGRLVLGVGLGSDADYRLFGEVGERRVQGAMLDEGLQLVDQLWSGGRVTSQGEHYDVRDVVSRPRPLQRPRIPIWVAGNWPGTNPFRRAAGWDGVVPQGRGVELHPADFMEISKFISVFRKKTDPFALVHIGRTPDSSAKSRQMVAAYAECGVNWWLENCGVSWRSGALKAAPLPTIRDRISAGPPRPHSLDPHVPLGLPRVDGHP